MHYLFLVYQNEAGWAELSISQRQTLTEAGSSYEDQLRQQGYLLGVEDFQHSQTVLNLQMEAGEVLLAEGETAETKQNLIQLYLIKARDLNEAVLVGSKMPQLRQGAIEIRPLLKMEWPEST